MGQRKHVVGTARRRPLPQKATVIADAREHPGFIWRTFVSFLLPLLICVPLAAVILDIVPSWSAKLGHGVHGTFTAQYCEHGKAGCYWDGDFVSDDGTDQRFDVGVDGDSGITAPGQQIPALDTGDRVNVYPIGGGSDWAFVTIFAVLLLLALGFWIAKVPVAAFRRAARRRRPSEPTTG